MTPTVTIGMSVRDGESTLHLALASLVAQTYRDWELLILDDGSSDRSSEIAHEAAARDDRIRPIGEGASLGLATRLNEAVDAARGSLFARMDADDVAYPRRLELQVAHLESHPEVDLVGSPMVVFASDGRAIGKRSAPATHVEICSRPASGFRLFHPTWLGRIEWFHRYRYAPDAERCEDQDLLHRAHRESVFANLDQPLLGYRESSLVLRHLIVGRANLASRIARRLWWEHRRTRALATIGEQVAKGCVDAVAVTTGLDHRLLRHRAGPLAPVELRDWREVFASVAAEASSSAR